MSGGILTFTNLFPSAVMPTHGLFVRERMARVAAAGPFRWQVMAPVPKVAFFLRGGLYQRWAEVPVREQQDSVTVLHPRYRHWPGLSLRRQADAMARCALQLARTATREGPWVIDAHYLWPDGVAAASVAQQLGLPYSLTARGSDLNVVANDPVVARRIRAVAGGALFCAAVSDALADRFAAVAGLPRDRVVTVRNGVDLQRYRPGDRPADRAAARASLGLPPTGTLLLGVGRLVVAKGFGLCAEILAQLPPDVRLVLVGDGPDRSAIAELAPDRTIFLGTLPPARVAEAYRACDLLVLPSEREGWPNVITEALASGLRVVASRVGGIPQILGDPHPDDLALGTLVAPGSADALRDGIRRVLAVPADGPAVRAFAERYGWEQPVAWLVERFRTALAGQETAP